MGNYAKAAESERESKYAEQKYWLSSNSFAQLPEVGTADELHQRVARRQPADLDFRQAQASAQWRQDRKQNRKTDDAREQR